MGICNMDQKETSVMNKKKIITLSLVLVVLAAVLAVLLMLPEKEVPVPETGESHSAEESKGGILYSVNHDSITSVSLSIDGEGFTFTLDGNEWKCPDKPNVVISQSKVGSLVAHICSVTYEDKVESADVTEADCGIGEDSATVVFQSEKGEVVLRVGNKVPNTGLCYFTSTLAEGIYMIKTENAEAMFAPFEDYRSDDFHVVDFENLASIHLKNNNFEAKLTRSETDVQGGVFYEWRFESPVSVFARDEEVNAKLISPVNRLSVDEYVSDNGDFANYGISKDKYITFGDKSGKTQTVYFSDRKDGKYYICVDDKPNIYAVSSSLLPLADVKLIDIADRQVYLTKNENIDTVTVSAEGINYELKFGEEDITVNGNKITDKVEKNDIFANVVSLFADDIYQGEAGSAEVTITFSLKDETNVVLEFSSHDDRHYAVSKNGETVYLILKNKLDALFDALEKYVK